MSPKKPQLDIEKYPIHCNTLYAFSHSLVDVVRELSSLRRLRDVLLPVPVSLVYHIGFSLSSDPRVALTL